MNPETQIVNAIVRRLERLRDKEGLPLWWVKMHGSAFGRAGIPDLLISLAGFMVAMEVKIPTGKVRPIQKAMMQRIGNSGATVAVVTSADQAEQLIGDLFKGFSRGV